MNKWLLRSLLILSVCAVALSLIQMPKVKAWSTETTGLTLYGFSRNQGKYAHTTAYEIFATDQTILFYDGNGALIKTWDLVFSHSKASTPWIVTDIAALNDSFLLVASSYRNGTSTYFSIFDVFVLNINTLTYTTNTAISVGGNSNEGGGDQVLVKLGTAYYAVVSNRAWPLASATHYTYLYNIYPTFSQITAQNESTQILGGRSIWIPSVIEANTAYIITGYATDSLSGAAFLWGKYSVWKFNFVTPTVSLIGSGSNNITWSSNYTYYLGYRNHNITGSNYYDVGVWYPIDVNKTIVPEIIRFNDTYVADFRGLTLSPSMPVNIPRPFCARYPSTMTGENDLTDSPDYNIVYIGGASYELMQINIQLSGLDTANPAWTELFNPVTYQGKTHYYTSSNNVGGYQPSAYSVGIELDYANGKAVADTFTAPNPAFSYVYWLSPPATSQLDYDFSVTIGQAYTYYGEVFIGQTLSGNGNYRLYARNDTSAAYALMGTGTFSAGQLNFTFIIGAPQVYWEINITMTDYSNTVKTIDHYILGYTSTVSPTPGSTIGDISGAASYGATFVVVFLPPLLIILGPALILGMYIGTPGFLGGLIMGLVIAVNTIWSNVALWAIAAIVFAGVLLLLFGAGGVGTAGGTQPSIAVRAYQKRQAKRAERKSEQEERQRERGYLA